MPSHAKVGNLSVVVFGCTLTAARARFLLTIGTREEPVWTIILGWYSCAAVRKAPQQLHPGACDRRLRGRTMHAEVPCPRRDAYLPPYAWAWLWQPQLHGRLASPHTRADFRDCGETILSCVACVCCSPSLVEARANMHTGRLERRGRPQLAAFACLETVLDPRRLRCFHWVCDILEHMQALR